VLRESPRRAEAGDPQSKLRTSRHAGASAASHQREQRHDQHRSRQQNHQDLRADQRQPGQPVHAGGGQLEAGVERRHRQQVLCLLSVGMLVLALGVTQWRRRNLQPPD